MARRQWEEDNEDSQRPEDVHEEPREAVEKEEPIKTSNREELMECIKSGKSTVWVPSRALERLAAEHSNGDRESAGQRFVSMQGPMPQELGTPSSPSHIIPCPSHAPEDPIERPRSALHAGDFRQNGPAVRTPHRSRCTGRQDQNASFENFSASPPPWLASPPVPSFGRFNTDPRSLASAQAEGPRHSRAPSLGSSLSSSFVMRVPTSPWSMPPATPRTILMCRLCRRALTKPTAGGRCHQSHSGHSNPSQPISMLQISADHLYNRRRIVRTRCQLVVTSHVDRSHHSRINLLRSATSLHYFEQRDHLHHLRPLLEHQWWAHSRNRSSEVECPRHRPSPLTSLHKSACWAKVLQT